MYINYKNVLYRYLDDDGELLTYKADKTDSTFEFDDGIYYKAIEQDDPDIVDVYTVHYLIDYDTGLDCVPTTWKVDTSRVEFMNDEVLLVFEQGRLPDWEILENTVCQKCVELEECGTIKIVYKYDVKNGEKYNPLLRVEKDLTKDQFREVFERYVDENI